MFIRLGRLIARHWFLVILSWIAIVALTRWFAPRWDDVTYDGDLAYMPSYLSSVKAERLLEEAFPRGRAKSEIVVIATRADEPLKPECLLFVDLIAARLHNLHGVSCFQESQPLWQLAAELRDQGDTSEAERVFQQADQLQRTAESAWEEALRLDPEYSAALNNRAYYFAFIGKEEEAEKSRMLALDFAPQMENVGEQLEPADLGQLPIIDIWTRHNEVMGEKLRSRDNMADLIIVRMWQEFMATDNIRVLEWIESAIDDVKAAHEVPPGLELGITGSGAVGGDMLRSAAQSIQNTELFTVLLVVAILVVVYRSPILVAVPLVTIVVSVVVASGVVAALTQLGTLPGFEWWNFKVFTTTRIFVVVILFGAGTDYCLFLIARYREELEAGKDRATAVADALTGVGDALAASALTTIIGLGTMLFAEFGKFRNSGPAIGLCLFVTLIACITLAPALLRALGPIVFWPLGVGPVAKPKSRRIADESPSRFGRHWDAVARAIVTSPGRILVICTAIMLPFALYGSNVRVTYDFLSELEPDRPSRRGAAMMQRHYPIGETGPVIVLAKTTDGDLDAAEGKRALHDLTKAIYVPGVVSVRSLDEPQGNRPGGWSVAKAARQTHPLTRALYLSKHPEGDIARFEVVLKHDPFTLESAQVLAAIDEKLGQLKTTSPYWRSAEFLYAGTTAAIRDLRQVTSRDNLQIQILVVLAVLLVLLVILRRPVVCLYLILSVLFSYYVTLGITERFFQLAYGETFQGLDWKVPLFLFVILVAIGQDYNIYLVTRVFEEQERHGMFGGLRRAIVRTGGIITSCGVIMAGTFVSMTTGSLRGIVELGFALSLGVLLDTFVVRPILVPAFLALLFRRHTSTRSIGAWIRPPHLRRGRARRPSRSSPPIGYSKR